MTHTRFSPPASDQAAVATKDGAHQAFLLLRTVFTIAPIVFGLDKFLGLLTDWDAYLAPWINDIEVMEDGTIYATQTGGTDPASWRAVSAGGTASSSGTMPKFGSCHGIKESV